ncbi:MAG: response regulator [Dokdonella sp.]|nr:MAG: response regulator [Dokdonella sp.]
MVTANRFHPWPCGNIVLAPMQEQALNDNAASGCRYTKVKQILIADDNPLTLAWFDEAIRRVGFTPVLAANSEQAVALAIGDAFALMLIDANMPDRSGAATLAEIRSGGGPNRQTLAVLTSADSSILRSAARDLGFADVLHKPFALEDLKAILGQAIGHDAIGGAGVCLLDEEQSRRSSGGNDAIAAALRTLFVKELDELPVEMDVMAGNADLSALRDRLHRLDASAGICGTPLLAEACRTLRKQINADAQWPARAILDFLAASEHTLAALRNSLEENAP